MDINSELIHILLVEDVETIRKGLLLSTPWIKLGCAVVGEAGDGEEALELYKRLRPDIVITDIRLPKMDGLSFIKQAKAIAPCEFIVISAYRDFTYAQTVIESSGRAYLLKPVDTDELFQVLKAIVDDLREKRRNEQMVAFMNGSLDNEFLQIMSSISNNRLHNKYLNQAIQVVAERCAEPLTVKIVADELNISDSYLTKLFKSNTNYTFLEILTVYRMKKALALLYETDMKIYEIAEEVGYQDTRYFSMVFQKYLGVSPSQYRSGN